jgi:uncharacterized DUF497 family protein
MQFEWDEKKARTNRIKHRVDFELVVRFEFRSALIELDDDLDYGEERWSAIGWIGLGLFTLVYVERSDAIRVISLRKATNDEKRRYGKYIS